MNQYQQLKQIGSGSFGNVFKVLDLKDKKEYALKQMVCKDMNEANFCLKEIFNLQTLKHENLIEYKNVFLHETNIGNNLFGKTLYVCVVMPLYSNGDLENMVNSVYHHKGVLDELQIIDFGIQLADAIDYLHKNHVMHRDLKPANIFMTKKDDKFQLKLGDFGLSTKLNDEDNFKSSIVGTPAYVAPEVFLKKYDYSIDVFSFGAILYKLLTGKERALYIELTNKPNDTFQSISFDIQKKYQPFWVQLVTSMISVTPQSRPKPSEVKDMLKDYLSSLQKKQQIINQKQIEKPVQQQQPIQQPIQPIYQTKPYQPVYNVTPQEKKIEKPVEPKKDFPYVSELILLAEMGFTDRELCMELLRKHKGDITLVVRAILE